MVWNFGQNWLAQTQSKYRYNVPLMRGTLARRKGKCKAENTLKNHLKSLNAKLILRYKR